MRSRMRVLSTDGVEGVEVGDSEASIVGSHWNAVRNFLVDGETSRLAEFEGVVIAGVELETNPDAIEEWWRRRELDFLEIYES